MIKLELSSFKDLLINDKINIENNKKQLILSAINDCLQEIENARWERHNYFPEYDPSRYPKEDPSKLNRLTGLVNLREHSQNPRYVPSIEDRKKWQEIINEHIKNEYRNPTKPLPLFDPEAIARRQKQREEGMAEILKEKARNKR